MDAVEAVEQRWLSVVGDGWRITNTSNKHQQKQHASASATSISISNKQQQKQHANANATSKSKSNKQQQQAAATAAGRVRAPYP
jgi:hypothetical protein